MVEKSQHQYQVKLARSPLEERRIFCIAPTHGRSGVSDVDHQRQDVEIRSCGAPPGFSDDNGVEISGDDLGAAARYQLTEVPRIAAEVAVSLGRTLTSPGGDPLFFFLKFFIRITQMLCVRRPSGLGLRRPDGMEQAAQISKLALQDKAGFLGILLASGTVELLVVPCHHPPAQPGWQ